MRGNSAGWASPWVVAPLVAGLMLAGTFVVCERCAREPMVPMRLFRSRAFSSGIASSFLFYASMYGVMFLLPQFLQVAQGNGPLGAGLRLLPWTATLFVFAPIAGALINRIGERSLIVIGLLLQAIGIAWIGLTITPDLTYARLVTPLVLAGAGVSMAMPAAQNAVLSAVAPAEIGKASGTFNMFRYLAGAFGIAILVAVFAQAGGVHSAQAFSAGFAPALGVSAALSLLAAIVGLGQPARREVMLAPVGAKT
jgi:MFS family permease